MGELVSLAEQARNLTSRLELRLPRSGLSDLRLVLREAIAPLEPALARRGIRVHITGIASPVFIAMAPDLLCAGIRAAFEALARFAMTAEGLHVVYRREERMDVLEMTLFTHVLLPPDTALVEPEIRLLRLWVESRQGQLRVSSKSHAVSVAFFMPAKIP